MILIQFVGLVLGFASGFGEVDSVSQDLCDGSYGHSDAISFEMFVFLSHWESKGDLEADFL